MRPSYLQPKIGYFYSLAAVNTLLVLVVFLYLLPVMSSFSGAPVEMPSLIAVEPVSSKGQVIAINSRNSISIGKRSVTISECKSFFASLQNKDIDVLIKVDQKADVGTFAEILDVLRSSGIRKVNIAAAGIRDV